MITLSIPAFMLSAQRTAEKLEAARAEATARAAEIGAACAKDLAADLCLCSDFKTQDEAQIYVNALAALGRPPKRRFGLFTDGSDRPCAHLPNE